MRIVTLVLFSFNQLIGSLALAHGGAEEAGYEPCHLLCSTEGGRFNPNDDEIIYNESDWGFHFSTTYLQVLGHYEKQDYFPIRKSAKVTAIQFHPTLTWRYSPQWTLSGGLPFEYNKASGVVLPTLHHSDMTTSELALGGIWLAARRALETSAENTRLFAGFGYRLSSEIGTTDVSKSLETNPDKGIEALGIGSDDFFLSLARDYSTPGFGRSWMEIEFRAHMWPRWKRLFATTTSYLLRREFGIGKGWSLFGKVSGFYTDIPSLSVVQSSICMPGVGLQRFYGPQSTIEMSIASQVPGTTPWNRNAIRTVNYQLATNRSF